MIPKNGAGLIGLELKTPADKTYALNPEKNRVRGFADGKEALKQTIYLILNVERYRYPIFSWNYGAELQNLLGQPVAYVLPEIKRLVSEALTQDDRIESVDNFVFETRRGVVHVTFTAHTLLGDINAEMEARI